MWIWKCGCHQELEFGIIRNTLITETERTRFVDLFEKNWFQSRVKFLTDILNEAPFTKLNCEFQVPQQISITHLEDIQTLFSILTTEVFDELVSLVLRIDHQRPPSRSEHDNTVFN